MMNKANHGTWFIILTLVLALIMSLLPLPDSWQLWRPSWVMLVLSYWVIYLPHRIGLLWAFIFGFLLDVLLGTSLGLHSFALAISTFMVQMLHKRIRLFPQWKQAATMAFISFVYIIITFWLIRITGKSQEVLAWPAVIVNGILWPWLYLVVRSFSKYFKVA